MNTFTAYEVLTLVLRALTPAVAITALLLTWRHFSAAQAAAMMARFSGRDMVEMRHEIEALLSDMRLLSEQAKVERFRVICRRTKDTVELYNQLHAVSMFFAEIGVCFKSRLFVKREFVVFDRLLPYYWHELAPFIIAAHREHGFAINATTLHTRSIRTAAPVV